MKKNIMLVTLLSLFSCELLQRPTHQLTFVNNSDDDVYVEWISKYDDTLDLPYHNLYDNQSYHRVNKHSKKELGVAPKNHDWEGDFKYWGDTAMFFVIDSYLIDSMGKASLPEWIRLYNQTGVTELYNKIVKKRWTLSLSDINDMNWTITYP